MFPCPLQAHADAQVTMLLCSGAADFVFMPSGDARTSVVSGSANPTGEAQPGSLNPQQHSMPRDVDGAQR